MKKLLLLLLVVAGVATARPQGIVVSDDLKANATIFEVKGKQGWQFNQVIKFGGFYTSKIKRSWPGGIDVGFVNRFRSAKEKLSFTQYTPDSLNSTVIAVSKFMSFETDFLNGFMGLSYNYENSFAGCIVPQNTPDNSWEFVVTDPDLILDKSAGCGEAKDKNGRQITIRGVTLLEGQAKWMAGQVWGFEFFLDKKSIAAVSVTGNGKVYLRNDLAPDLRLVIAAMSSALMVRHDLSENL